MSPLTRMICLANSWKLHERCVAGIEINTEKWIRPVCDQEFPEDGRIPQRVRLVEGREPKLLDILAIPLAKTGNDFGFETENRSVIPGEWHLLGKAGAIDVLRYCSQEHYILHNDCKYVTIPDLQALPFHQRQTIQLVRVVEFSVKHRRSRKGVLQWLGTIQTVNGQILVDASITDPVFVHKLEAGQQPKKSCLVTVSLSIPWRPSNWEGGDPCWKLIAGVIDL